MASDITVSQVNKSMVDNVDAYEDTTVRQVITKKDLWICSLRGLFMEGNFNFERMQGGVRLFYYPCVEKDPWQQ